jgi:hypothetical protein
VLRSWPCSTLSKPVSLSPLLAVNGFCKCGENWSHANPESSNGVDDMRMELLLCGQMRAICVNAQESPSQPGSGFKGSLSSRLCLYGIWAALAAGMALYAQTLAFTDDEGFHLMAAQLIKAGMRPYLDFCFPQTPLNAYWNAFWMRVFGESWRTAHALAALETWAAMVLAAQFVLTRLPERAWRVAGAIAATMMISCTTNLVEFGPLGQAYGMCLLTTVCALRLAVIAVERPVWWLATGAGAFAGVGAASSLLSASVVPVLLVWVWRCNRAGSRWSKAGAFVIGTAVPFLPVFWLFVKSPWVVWFNIVRYHLYYRVVYWSHPLGHDLQTVTGWITDSQSLLLGLLGIFGVIYIARRSAWSRECRSEFYLCGWLALGMTAELAFARPTFPRYFCLLVPFVGILAVPGLYAIGSRVLQPERPFWPVLIISVIFAGALAWNIADHSSGSYNWRQYEDIARKAAEVTPRNKQIFAEEEVYFLMKRRPPFGLEFQYSQKLDLPSERLAALHITPESELKKKLAAGTFWSAATCDDDMIDDFNLDKTFGSKVKVHDCPVYWNWKPSSSAEK